MKKIFTKLDIVIFNIFKKSPRIKILVLIPTLFLFISCEYGLPSMSGSIEESKEIGVFVSEYKPLKNPVIINDSLNFRIVACWLEKHWSQTSMNDHVELDGYQLVIHVEKKEQLKGFLKKWNIGSYYKRSFRSCGPTGIMTDFDSLPNKIEKWDIKKGFRLSESDSTIQKDIIGEFCLVKL